MPQPRDLTMKERVMETILRMQSSTIEIPFSGLKILFDVVPFPEAGYIGFYGFHVENLVPEHSIQKIPLQY